MMRDVVGTEDPAAFLDRLESAAERTETPCSDGTMVWRSWGAGPVLVLFHGGAGSWRHWAHNIDDLSRDHRLLVPDLPGLGESAMVPRPETAGAVAAVLARGIDLILGPDATYDVAGFSFGGTAASCLAALHGARARSLTIIGSSGVGPSGSQVQLLKVRHLTGEERVAAHRVNLSRLMIADPAKIDTMALLIQDWNTRHSRLKTPMLSRGGAILTALETTRSVTLNGIWGELDAPANPRTRERAAALRAIRPDVNFHMIAGAGHWVAYEAPEEFNATLREMLRRTRP
ncbi:MAG TPA: alpha/beta hydrolase [Acetobacteraceae bacterium]|jgi:pimeloyl-ACP methyl ester carboxylesterase|nr:alpha/beta hydrolase [Acetobacteraceae bacterium]